MSFLTQDYRRTTIRVPEKILSGLDAWVYGVQGSCYSSEGIVHELLKQSERVDALAHAWRDLSDEELSARLAEFQAAFRRGHDAAEAVLAPALAAIREAADRRLGLRAYVVQLAGALALFRGSVAEMETGEGKTLTAGLTCVLNGWTGMPCHVITVNDYLAERDADWLRPLYTFCHLSVGHVISQMEPDARREGYAQDITYTTSKEIVADFLRDRLWLGDRQKAGRRQISRLLGRGAQLDRGTVMRGIHTAIVDEADSILIDEAVTPLIISRAQTNEPFVEACRLANEIAGRLAPGVDYKVNEKYRDIELPDDFRARLDAETDHLRGMARGLGRRQELVHQALTAREFYKPDVQYVIQDDKIVIVDEFTGRLMPMRQWRAGLHQFVEAKEGVPITAPSETLARLSFQRFFRFFHKLAGMTGTAREAAAEFWHIYGMPVLAIPRNETCRREPYAPRVYVEDQAKWRAIVGEIVWMHMHERPVLVGTRSVQASEQLAARLDELALSYRLLNAVRHREEARIVAHAGEKSTITIATNMAGRGTDIKLAIGVPKLGGLHVIATECHEAGRIDRQLFGRCARQGDPGSARAFVSLEDELLRRYVPAAVRRTVARSVKAGTPGAKWLGYRLAGLAQNQAQHLAFKRRRSVLQMDTWLEDSLSFAQADVS
ncbi:MAG: prepilin peptidase [Kiritimatiellae bacterium]|nr:prepilin peptidase [Kiritimatiellia bacterium]